MARYAIEVKTGDIKRAGTDADVFIQLIGARGPRPIVQLDSPADDFEQNNTNHFTIDVEDVGWIDAIRLYHNNGGKNPGWFVDYVKITEESTGLCFRADFYRWLAKDELDRQIDVTQPVPLGDVGLSSGRLVKTFIGYDPHHLPNYSGSPAELSATFGATVRRGFSLKKSTATTVSAGAKVGAEIFGTKCEFTAGVTRSSLTELSTTEEQTLVATYLTKFTLQPGQLMTCVGLFYQHVLTGEATANNLRMGFEQRYPESVDPMLFDGLLSDSEVQERVVELLRSTAQHQGGDPSRVPTRVPREGAEVALRQTDVNGPVVKANVHTALATMGRGLVSPEALLGMAKPPKLLHATTVGTRLVRAHW